MRARDAAVRREEDTLAPLMDFCHISAAANTEIRKKLPTEWTLRDFETAVRLLLSLQEGINQKMDNSSFSTFQDALEALEWTQVSGFLDKTAARDKKVTMQKGYFMLSLEGIIICKRRRFGVTVSQ